MLQLKKKTQLHLKTKNYDKFSFNPETDNKFSFNLLKKQN